MSIFGDRTEALSPRRLTGDLAATMRRRLDIKQELEVFARPPYARGPVLSSVLIAGAGVTAVVVAATATWILRRVRVDDDQLGTISTQWIAEHRSHERDQVGH